MSPDNETEGSEAAQPEDLEELSDESLEAVAGGQSKSEDQNRDDGQQTE